MTTEQGTPVNGTLLRGADGELYFIPDENLAVFRVPDAIAAAATEPAGDDDTAGLLLTRPLTPQVTLIPALRGPLGLRASDSDKTMVTRPPTGFRL